MLTEYYAPQTLVTDGWKWVISTWEVIKSLLEEEHMWWEKDEIEGSYPFYLSFQSSEGDEEEKQTSLEEDLEGERGRVLVLEREVELEKDHQMVLERELE